MLSRDQLQELCQFKLRMKREYGILVNIEQLVQQKDYQDQIFEMAESSDDEDLVMLALTLRASYGSLQFIQAGNNHPTTEDEIKAKAKDHEEAVNYASWVKGGESLSPRTQPLVQHKKNIKKEELSKSQLDRYEEEARELEKSKYIIGLR